MRPATKITLAATLAFLAGIGVTLGLQAIYRRGGFLSDALDNVFHPPHTATKYLIMAIAILVFAMLPVGILEWTSERAFTKAEKAMRAARPSDIVTPYEGPEGRGLLFDGPGGRTLLLASTGGIGQPRVEEVPVPPATEDEEPMAQVEQADLAH